MLGHGNTYHGDHLSKGAEVVAQKVDTQVCEFACPETYPRHWARYRSTAEEVPYLP